MRTDDVRTQPEAEATSRPAKEISAETDGAPGPNSESEKSE
jgi:hypothetical protein